MGKHDKSPRIGLPIATSEELREAIEDQQRVHRIVSEVVRLAGVEVPDDVIAEVTVGMTPRILHGEFDHVEESDA